MQTLKLQKNMSSNISEITTLILAIFLPLLITFSVYFLLPSFGIDGPGNLMTGSNMLLLPIVLIGILIYTMVVEILIKRPWYIIFYTLVIWRFLIFWNYQETSIIHLNLRTLSFFIVGIPALFLLLKHFKTITAEMPYLKWLMIFNIIVIFYYFFHSSHFMNPNNTVATYMTASRIFLLDLSYTTLLGSIAYFSFKLHPNKDRLYDYISRIIIFSSIIESVITLCGYPFGLFSRFIEGYHRAQGFTLHPNELAFLNAIYILFMVGLINYRTTFSKQTSLSLKWVVAALALAIATFILALSKNAIACLALMIILYVTAFSIYTRNLRPLGYLLCISLLLPVIIMLYCSFTEVNLLDMFQDRMGDSRSFEWRLNVWGNILSSMNLKTLLIGNGLGSTDEFIYQMFSTLYADETNVFRTHNFTLQLLFEMGSLGLSYYIIYIVYFKNAFSRLKKMNRSQVSLLLAGMAIALYYLITCQFDEQGNVFPTGIMFMLITFNYCHSMLGSEAS